MIKTALCFVISFLIAASILATVGYASADDAGPVLIEPMAAGSAGAPVVTVNAAPGSTVNVEAPKVPDPVEDPSGAIDSLFGLYKKGALTPLFYLLGFFALVYAERKVAWLRTGYRKVAIASLLYGAGMLAERAIAGTTPTMAMLVTAVGASLLFAFKAVGPRTEPARA